MSWKYLSVAEMVAVEKAADSSGISYDQMMENAGRALSETVCSAHSHNRINNALGLVGKGNNGGDTLVALADLAERGWSVSAYIAGGRSQDDPLIQRFLSGGGKLYIDLEDQAYQKLSRLVGEHQLLLDGLLGTGIKLPLREPMPEVLRAVGNVLEAADVPPIVIAVDCPSGVDCDNGGAADETLHADMTVCMAAVKRGLLAFPAFNYVGDLRIVGIGLPDGFKPLELYNRFVLDKSYAFEHLPDRPLDGHKGTFGTALVVAGSENYCGAALLAGEAAYRSGAGLVTIAIPESLHAALAGHIPEATWLLLPQERGVITDSGSDLVISSLTRISALLIGPGFGLEETTKVFIDNILNKMERNTSPPMIFDADGLKLLSQIKDWEKKLPPNSILTPHPGEMSVMTGLSVKEIQSKRIDVAEEYAEKWGHLVVLKGAFTVIAAPTGQTAILPVASPALARAGSGDVLAGIIVGLLAQGVGAYQAAAVGIWLHGQAGLQAAEKRGSTAGVLAGDLVDEISNLMPY
ncbi:NAD(P)H-hydrate dehydratase [Chloroflexota bacterium]